jgi:hypothetical protein
MGYNTERGGNMNLVQLRSKTRKRLGDTNSAFWTDEELDDYINDACRDISFRTKSIRENGYITTVSCDFNDTATVSNEYSLSENFEDIYSVLEVYYFTSSNEWIRLDPRLRDDLDEEQNGWRGNIGYTYVAPTEEVYYNYNSRTSTPITYYWSREEDIIGIDPPPNDENTSDNNMRVYYAKRHVDLVDDTEIPQLPEPTHLAIINYAVAMGFEDRGWGDKANDNWNKYFAKLKDYKIETNREREDDELISTNYKRRR